MSYRFTPIDETEARTVLGWRYPGIGTLYDPDPDQLEDDVSVLLTPEYHYYVVRNGCGSLVGFCCFGDDARVPGGEYSLPAVDIGLGLHPDLIGQGQSHDFLAAILEWGRQCFQPEFFRATVAAINTRSQGMFARAGFLIIQRFKATGGEPIEFLVMLRAEREDEGVNG